MDSPYLRFVEFIGGPLDDECHLVPATAREPEDGLLEVVVAVGRLRVARYEWTEEMSHGSIRYRFVGYRDDD